MATHDDASFDNPQRHRLRLAFRVLGHALKTGTMPPSVGCELVRFLALLTLLPENELQEELESDPMLDRLVEGLSRIGRGDPPSA